MKSTGNYRSGSLHRILSLAIASAFVGAVVILGSTNAHAQGSGQGDQWQLSVTPYVWAAGIKGDSKIGSLPKTSVDLGFDSVLKNLDMSFQGIVEARRGDWMFILDGIYVSISDDKAAPGHLYGGAELKVEQQIIFLAGGYRLLHGPLALDALIGARYTSVKTDLTLTPGILRERGRSYREEWWDPVLGFQAQLPLNKGWSLIGYADVGGFDMGSRLTWQWFAGVNYEISPRFAAKAGYRYLYTDYDKDDFLYDMTLKGPYLGVSIIF